MAANNGAPLAVVTGASSGIGLELAKQFAEHGYDLLIAAEDAGILSAGHALRASGRRVTEAQVDLAKTEGRATVGNSYTSAPTAARTHKVLYFVGFGVEPNDLRRFWDLNWLPERATLPHIEIGVRV